MCRAGRVIDLFRIPSLTLALFPDCSPSSQILLKQAHEFGRFEFRESANGREGIVIGAPHAGTERNSDRLAMAISKRTGAGLVVAYGFKARRLSVAQPLVKSRPYPVSADDSFHRGSVFTEYTAVLKKAARGALKIYLGIHKSTDQRVSGDIEVATNGLTYEEARALKEAYLKIRDRLTDGAEAPRLGMMMEPLDQISWRTAGIRHHGVLLFAERGVDLRLPQGPGLQQTEGLYLEILSRWAEDVIRLLRDNPLGLPQEQVKVMDLGRLEMAGARRGLRGVVIGAPHGSFDRHTAEVAKEISYRTGLASVIAKGFTPTEAGGWRINVNRPTEKTFPSSGSELPSVRAKEVYNAFSKMVLEASSGSLKLYIDIHQYNTGSKVQVATIGISRPEAQTIKLRYHQIRDGFLSRRPAVPEVDLLIEPLEEVSLRASGAKSEGILALVEKGLHFELPSQTVFVTPQVRDAYTQILADLLGETVPLLLKSREYTTNDRQQRISSQQITDLSITTLAR